MNQSGYTKGNIPVQGGPQYKNKIKTTLKVQHRDSYKNKTTHTNTKALQ